MIEYCTINPINGGPETNDIVLKFYAVYIVWKKAENSGKRTDDPGACRLCIESHLQRFLREEMKT